MKCAVVDRHGELLREFNSPLEAIRWAESNLAGHQDDSSQNPEQEDPTGWDIEIR